jgi:hypothetical protein
MGNLAGTNGSDNLHLINFDVTRRLFSEVPPVMLNLL